jgi:hypothetical protein
LVNFTLNSENDGEKEIFISSFVLVLFFVIIYVLLLFFFLSKSIFFYVIYAKNGGKKTYLFDKTFLIPMNFIVINIKKYTEKKVNFYYISINFDWVLKIVFAGVVFKENDK